MEPTGSTTRHPADGRTERLDGRIKPGLALLAAILSVIGGHALAARGPTAAAIEASAQETLRP